MSEYYARPSNQSDIPQLEEWRQEFSEGSLELPHGYEGDGWETLIVERNGETLLSLTATLIVALDPLIRNPKASPLRVAAALALAEALLTARAKEAGAVDAYVAVPDSMQDYIAFLLDKGYERTAENCSILRRPLAVTVDEIVAESVR